MAYSGKSLKNDLQSCFKVLDIKRNKNGYAQLNGYAFLYKGIEPTQCAQRVYEEIKALIRKAGYDYDTMLWEITLYSGFDSPDAEQRVKGYDYITIEIVDHYGGSNVRTEVKFHRDEINTSSSEQLKEKIYSSLHSYLENRDEFEALCLELSVAETKAEAFRLHERIGNFLKSYYT